MRRTPSIEIIFRNADHSVAADAFARGQVEKLLALFDGADGRRVSIEPLPQHPREKGCRIRIELASRLALQLRFSLEVGSPSVGLMGAAPE